MRINALFWGACCGILLLGQGVFSQDKDRFVREPKRFPRQPIEIVSKAVKDRQLSPEGRVVASQHWLRDLTLTIKNISNKNIVGAYIHLEIDATGNMALPLVMPIVFRASENPSLTLSRKNILLPGESTIVSTKYYQNAMDALKRFGVVDVVSTTLSVRRVEFDDDTRWNVGFDNRKNPLDESEWMVMEKPKKLQIFF